MKKQVSVTIAVLFSLNSISAQAFLDFDNSVHYYRYTNVNVDMTPIRDLTKAVDQMGNKIVGSTEKQTFLNQKSKLTQQYNLNKIGKSIGIDLDASKSDKFVEQYGLTAFKEFIEHRIVNLKINSALAANIIFSLTGKNLVKGEDISGVKTGRNFVKEANEAGNFQAVFELVDFTVKNPEYYTSESVVEAFDILKKNSRSKLAPVDPDEKIILREKEAKSLNDSLRLAIVESIRSSMNDGFDFTGLDASNIDSKEGGSLIANNAEVLANKLGSTITKEANLVCSDKVIEQRLHESYKLLNRMKNQHKNALTPRPKPIYKTEWEAMAAENEAEAYNNKVVSRFIGEGRQLQNCRPTENNLISSHQSINDLLYWARTCSEVLPLVEKKYNCSRTELKFSALEKLLRKKGKSGKPTSQSVAVAH